MRARLEVLLAWLRAQRAPVLVGLGLAAVIVTCLLVGRAGFQRATQLRREAMVLEQVEREAQRWAAEYRAATPAESLVWRRSEREVSELGIDARDRVTIAQVVTQRADDIGVREIRVRFESTDTIAAAPMRAVGPWSFRMAPSALVVDARADFTALVDFLGVLPPQVEVRRITLVREPNDVRASLFLIIYQNAGGDAANAGAVSADADSGGHGSGPAGARALGDPRATVPHG